MRSERMPVSDEEEALVLLLHLNEGTYGAKVIP